MISLKLISWIASFISIIGIILNAYLIIWCWPVWMVGNMFWIYWGYKKKEWAQVILWTIFQLTNAYGWYIWSIN